VVPRPRRPWPPARQPEVNVLDFRAGSDAGVGVDDAAGAAGGVGVDDVVPRDGVAAAVVV
jgi:hypothetical protein